MAPTSRKGTSHTKRIIQLTFVVVIVGVLLIGRAFPVYQPTPHGDVLEGTNPLFIETKLPVLATSPQITEAVEHPKTTAVKGSMPLSSSSAPQSSSTVVLPYVYPVHRVLPPLRQLKRWRRLPASHTV